MRFTLALACITFIVSQPSTASADDWPEFRGKGRLGVWRETGLLETFPSTGLKIRWRTPVKAGYAGPAIADGRVFVTDWEP
ncbi:uncharacterized protein METZ01_LOCUS419529, partial [marine metagenome]